MNNTTDLRIPNDPHILQFTYTICVVIGAVLLVAIIVMNTLLWLYIRSTKQTASIMFVKMIILITFSSVILIIPTRIYSYLYNKHTNTIVNCSRLARLTASILISAFLGNAFQLAGLVMHRYYFVTNKDPFKIVAHTFRFVLMLFLIGCTTSPIILFLVINGETQSSCSMSMYESIKTGNKKGNIYGLIVLALVLILGIFCFIITLVFTVLLKRHLISHEEITSITLQIKKSINLKRLNATNYFWISFYSIWIPLGVAQIVRLELSHDLIAVAVFHVFLMISFSSFLVVPCVYLKMDTGFYIYIKKLVLKSRVDVASNNTVNNTIVVKPYAA